MLLIAGNITIGTVIGQMISHEPGITMIPGVKITVYELRRTQNRSPRSTQMSLHGISAISLMSCVLTVYRQLMTTVPNSHVQSVELAGAKPEHCLSIPGVGAGQVRVDAGLDSIIQCRGCPCTWWCPELLLNNGGLFHLANLAQVSLEVDFHPDITLQVFCLDHCHGNIGLHRR